jgi:predicted O-methyltransferase YrrM
VSLLTHDGDSPHDQGHWKYCKQWRTVTVSNNPGWIWIRHGDTYTTTLQKYRRTQVNRIDAPRFNINLRAVDRAITASGTASADYKEHRSLVSDWLFVFGSDKVSLHTYGEFYDSLFKQLRPTNVLEVGVYAGASLNAWHMAGAYTVGVDIAPKCDDAGDQIIVARMPQEADRLISELPQQDIIIDDGSHKFSDYTQTYDKLKMLLKPNGVYVIEDVQSQPEVAALQSAGWNIKDWRSTSGRYDDVIAWRTN